MVTNNTNLPNRVLVSGVTFILWLVTGALAFWEMVVIREMALRTYARFFPGDTSSVAAYEGGVALGTWIMVPLVILAIAVLIGGAEYHYKHLGQPQSWKVFSWTLALELSILVLALFI